MPELFVFITITIFAFTSWGLFSLCQHLVETK